MPDDSAASKTGLYEPLLPPAFEVSDSNTGAYALLTAVIMIVVAGLAICVKLQMTASTFRKLRLDDVALISALVRLLSMCRSSGTDVSRFSAWDIQSRYVELCDMDLDPLRRN